MNKEIGGCGGGDGGCGGAGGGTWSSSSSLRLQPRDMFGCRNGIRGSVIPDFLTKTFNIVNDPNTNYIISWSLSGNSFIIWDHIKFSAEILPRYFKHNNLSSFVYQLNNYCFRKIGVDHQWEYENPNFQAGKEYLLANIKRRGQNREIIKRNPSCRSIHNNAVEIKTEILKNEINESKLEIEKLKTQQSDVEFHITAIESEMKIFERKSKKLMIYWAKACDELVFKIRKDNKIGKKENRDDDDQSRKKRKLDKNDKTGLINPGFEDFDGKNCDQDQEKTVVIEDASVESTAADYSEVGLENNSADYMYWKKILQEDDEVCEINEAAGTEMANKQAKIALDLEGLIAKLADQETERVNATV